MKPSDDFSLYQKIWDFTREQLSVKYPFFRKLLWNFSFEESEDTKSAGTDGKIIYFNPDFLLKSFQESSTKLEELFLHMLYHCLFLYPESRMTSGNYSSAMISGYQRGGFPLTSTISAGFDINF